MEHNEINYHLDNCLIMKIIQDAGYKKFQVLVQDERDKAAGLLTWEASAYLAIHNYYNPL